MLLLLAPVLPFFLLLRAVLRPSRYARRGYTFSPYGCHGRLFGSFLPILLLVALERFTTRLY